MADKKISALTASSVPLAGTEVLPIVQSGATVKVPVSDLTAGRNVSMSGGTVTSGGVIRSYRPDNAIYTDQSMAAGAGGGYIFNNANGDGFKWQYAGTDQFLIDTSGNAKVSLGNLVIGTSGKGIDFSATAGTGTSELLADYEEGDWTPTNTNAVTVNSAKYTKIGRIVICTFDITAGGSATTGDMGGLPFNATNPTSGGVLSYHNENGTETWSVSIEASGAAAWSFRLGSTQKQLSAGKNAKGMITYSL